MSFSGREAKYFPKQMRCLLFEDNLLAKLDKEFWSMISEEIRRIFSIDMSDRMAKAEIESNLMLSSFLHSKQSVDQPQSLLKQRDLI